jgi:hypothetical protein
MTETGKQMKDALSLYLALMEEIKFRIAYVKDIIHGKNLVAGTIGKDICYLQLRMVCEIIALSSLIAHGHIRSQNKKLWKKYQADQLIEQMERVHPNFYPQPANYPFGGFPTKAGEIRVEPVPLTSGFLTSAALCSLYYECGRELHRGSLKVIFERTGRKVEINYSPIGKWVDKIVTLLKFHRIRMMNRQEYWIDMESPHAKGKPYATTMSAPFRFT